jgi:hypothetical protein
MVETQKPRRRRKARNFTEALHLVAESLREDFAKISKEELAERMTTYVPGVEHRWFGRPVEPITKEELLAHWNGGPEPEIRYKDVPTTTATK